ncbi:F-box protein CPR1-like [Bidens hawaiensis]|uniref:F-box protein CPR1-like n=1 Tax=Bidens hawaiensis TaxID=980011 RepID=UPI0040492F18
MGKLPKQQTTIEKLPREVISDILIRLPAKRIAQLRCVSKPWNSLLSQPSFIKSHLHRSIHKNDEILMVIYDRFCFEDCMPITGFPSHSPHIEYPNFIKLPSTINFPPEYYASTVIGQINGLICFVLWDDETLARPDPIIYIWNPSLNALRILPPYTITSPQLLGFLNTDYYIRFGYDANTDDYKVVKLTFELRRREWLQVEVYSMRKGSWSIINDRFPSSVNCFWLMNKHSNSMTGNDGRDGHLHWLFKDGDKTNVVVAFDLSTEIFSEISLPDLLAKFDTKDQRMVLGDLAGKLCLMLNIENGGIEVWVMNEYGVAESWVKHLEFSQFNGNTFPMGFTLTNQFLMQDNDKQLALYDQSAGKVKSFKVFSCYRFRIVPYVDSLVWIAPAN